MLRRDRKVIEIIRSLNKEMKETAYKLILKMIGTDMIIPIPFMCLLDLFAQMTQKWVYDNDHNHLKEKE